MVELQRRIRYTPVMANHILKNDNKVLQGLFQKVEYIRHLNNLFKKHAEPELAQHAHVTKLEKNCLFVLTENGNWATQLRFQIPHLLAALRGYPGLENLSGIICKTRPPLVTEKAPPPQKRTPAKLSPETAMNILRSAESIQDSKLRGILEKIAGHLKSSST